ASRRSAILDPNTRCVRAPLFVCQRVQSWTDLLDTVISTNRRLGNRGRSSGSGKRFQFRCSQTALATTRSVVRQTRTCRNKTADNNIFLQATQGIARATNRRFGKNASGFLERGGRDERLGRQRCLGDAQQDRLVLGRTLALGYRTVVFAVDAHALDLLAAQVMAVARLDDLDLAQHLANDRFNVLVVDLHALQAIHVLDFLDQVRSQRLHAEQAQDVVRARLAVDDGFALLHVLALEHDDLTPLRNQLLVFVAVDVLDDQALLALGILAEADDAGALGQDRRLLRLACLEQIGHARQTAGDVAGLRRLLRDTGNHVAHAHFGAVLDRHDRAGRQEVLRSDVGTRQLQLAALGIFQTHDRTQVLRLRAATLRIGDHRRLQAGQFVGLALHGNAVEEVDEANHAGHFGDDRMGMRIPAGHGLARLDRRTVLDRNVRTVRHLVALALAAAGVDHAQLARTGHGHQMTLLVLHRFQVVVLQRAGGLHRHVVHGGRTRSRTTDVEGTHGQLGAGLADRLRGDHTHGLAHVDQVTTSQIATVAELAHAMLGFAGDRRTHLDQLHAGLVELFDQGLVEQGVAGDDRLVVVAGGVDVLDHHTAQHTLAQWLDHIAALDDRLHGDTVLGAAIIQRDDHVLRHVDQATGQVTGVRGLQRRIRQALARAVGRVEVLQHVQAFAEVGLDRGLDDRAVRPRHQATHAGQLANLRHRATRTGVGHDVQR